MPPWSNYIAQLPLQSHSSNSRYHNTQWPSVQPLINLNEMCFLSLSLQAAVCLNLLPRAFSPTQIPRSSYLPGSFEKDRVCSSRPRIGEAEVLGFLLRESGEGYSVPMTT